MKLTIIFFIIIFIFPLFAKTNSKKYIELGQFCKNYAFDLKIDLDKQKIILKKNIFFIKMTLDSKIALINDNKVLFLKKAIWLNNEKVMLEKSFVNQILKYSIIINKNDKYNKKKEINYIILDAGHGGKDPGNINNGIKEKELNLIITHKLAKNLKKNKPKLKIVLTRENDKFISLEKRSLKVLNISNKNFNKGIFISIHANASLNNKSMGIENYFYSSTPNNDHHNRLECFKKITNHFTKNTKVHEIISKLYDFQISRESFTLAKIVNKFMFNKVKKYTINRGVKAHRPYFVITRNNLPSILIETGFLSNEIEANKLKTNSYQELLATGISDGIINFINNFNP